MSANFTHMKLNLLALIAEDENIPHASFRLAHIIMTKHLNSDTRTARPTLATLKAAMHCNETTVWRNLDPLIAQGYMTRETGHTGKANVYTFNFDKLPKDDDAPPAKMQGVDEEPPAKMQPTPCKSATDPLHSFTTNPSIFPSTLPRGGSSSEEPPPASTVSDAVKEEFEDQFWPKCPKQVGKQDALKQFIIARKETPLNEIMAGLAIYATTVDRSQSGRFIKQPANWLRDKRWTDRPVSNGSGGTIDQDGNAVAHTRQQPSVADVIRAMQAQRNGQ